MRIKLDENITSELVSLLSADDHDVDTVATEGLTGYPDTAIWEAAQQTNRFLITQDLDFSDTRKFKPGAHCGLLVLRLWMPGRLAQVAYVKGLLEDYDLDDWAGCHVTATDRKVRIRRGKSKA